MPTQTYVTEQQWIDHVLKGAQEVAPTLTGSRIRYRDYEITIDYGTVTKIVQIRGATTIGRIHLYNLSELIPRFFLDEEGNPMVHLEGIRTGLAHIILTLI